MGNKSAKEDKSKTAQNETSKQKVNSKKHAVDFKLHIAIDFGTDGCGVAIAHDGKVHIYDKWKTSKRDRTVKTKTHILLNEQNKVMNFGNNAKFMYSELEGKEKKTMKFFERFKMALYADDINSDNDMDIKQDDVDNVVDIKKYIKASNGKPLLASIVFVEAFKHLQDKAKKYLFKITKENIEDNEIQWILTVPAIWSESAKDKMRRWIIEAELVDDSIIDQCVIVYEPDCASLALQKEYFQHIYDNDGVEIAANPTDDMDEDAMDDIKQNDRFEEGDKYILVDAGGGTVDVACHEILKDGSVEEIVWPTGGDWGSCYIDDLYIKLLRDIFGEELIDYYKKQEPSEYVKITDHFQAAKKQFYENKQADTHRVQLPFEFVQYLEEKLDAQGDTVEDKVHQYHKSLQYFKELFLDEKGYELVESPKAKEKESKSEASDDNVCNIKLISSNDNAQFQDSDEFLEMDSIIWRCVFDSKIDKIVSHVHDLLKRPLLKNNCKYLCLVGGFSSSKYLQERMRNEFGTESQYNLKFVIPRKPILSVVQGAAYFAIEPGYIKARKLKYTYGMSVYFTKQAAQKRGISDEHIESHLTNEGMVTNCFHVIAKKNARVAFGEVKLNKAQRVPGMKKAYIQILCSDKQDPKVTSDGKYLGSFEVIYDDDDKGEIMTELQFYGTMFKVYSYATSNKENRTELEITYEK